MARTEVSFRRVDSVDLLRGIIMILMALDHTRDYFGAASVNPTDLATTTPALFFTRWITHICAPVFFLVTGTGSYLALRKRTRNQLSIYLLTRGLWLIFLEFTVMRLILQFNVDYRVTIVTVFWALGWSMICLAALVQLPTAIVAGFGVVLVLGHNLFDGFAPSGAGFAGVLWTILHRPGFIVAGDHSVFAAYPLVPWIGVTALGYALGTFYTLAPERRQALLLRAGAAALAAFVVLRALNSYGDPQRWSPQHTPIFTVMSFLNTTKYPPSLLFLLMTLGPALLMLRAFDGRTPRALEPALVIGRVPFFYFVLHFFFIHVLAVIVSAVRYGSIHWMFESPTLDKYPITQPAGWPVSLPIVYLIWATVVVLLYPLCRWYAALRSRSRNPLLSYL
jgi:uncharacterized membrane protein